MLVRWHLPFLSIYDYPGAMYSELPTSGFGKPAGGEGVHPAGHESRVRLLRFCLLLLYCSTQLRLEEDTWHSSGVCPCCTTS